MTNKLHIIPHKHVVTKADRNRQRGHGSLLVWFVGLSGSGKSTLANAVEKQLFEEGFATYILDGDNIRSGLNSDLDFSDTSRKENIRRIGEVAHLMVEAGVITLTAFISPFKEEREKVKNRVGANNFMEVYVNCPLAECEKRDVKGLYKKARSGEIPNFTGINSPFEAPENPDVEVLSATLTVEDGAKKIVEQIKIRLKSLAG